MAGSITSPGPNVSPSQNKVALPTNYITDFDFIKQELPDLYPDEFERYGNRTVNSFLRMTGSELPSNSDLIKWSEQGRLHIKHEACTTTGADGATASTAVPFLTAGEDCMFRVGQTVLLSLDSGSVSANGVVTAVGSGTVAGTADSYEVAYYQASQPAGFNAGAITVFAYGSEYRKGTDGMQEALQANVDVFQVKPIIIKDHYEVAGSDMAQIGWISGSTESGSTGYYWYLKSSSETRIRFEDYTETALIEGVRAADSSGAEAYFMPTGAAASTTHAGTQGLFAAIEDRGNIWSGGNPTVLADYDAILKRLDKQGSISENVIFGNRDMNLDLDDMLAAQNSYGVGGTSYGLFDNDKDMALELGFTGFIRGGYEFYKTDWKYLNHATLRGGIDGGNVNGVIVPAGTMSVYDQVLGQNATRPFLHVRYRKAPNEDRKFKSWITGSAGGANTNAIDKMTVEFLTERALCTMGANNFFLIKD